MAAIFPLVVTVLSTLLTSRNVPKFWGNYKNFLYPGQTSQWINEWWFLSTQSICGTFWAPATVQSSCMCKLLQKLARPVSDHCDGIEIEVKVAQADGVVIGNIFD